MTHHMKANPTVHINFEVGLIDHAAVVSLKVIDDHPDVDNFECDLPPESAIMLATQLLNHAAQAKEIGAAYTKGRRL